MDDSERLAEFWDLMHSTQHRAYLGGTCENEIETLGLSPEDLRHKDVLVIGIGLGKTVARLLDLESRLSVMDISRVALDKVRESVVRCYRPDDDLPPEAFDYVLCASTVQHMKWQDFEVQMRKVLGSVRKIYAVHFVHIDGTMPRGTLSWQAELDGTSDDYGHCVGGSVSYSPARVFDMARRNGGRMTWLSLPVPTRVPNLYAYSAHIVPVGRTEK